MKVGERTNTMARLFNNREGFTAADDILPDRLFEGIGNGHLQGRGSTVTSSSRAASVLRDGRVGRERVPTPAKLAELGLTWAAQPAEVSAP